MPSLTTESKSSVPIYSPLPYHTRLAHPFPFPSVHRKRGQAPARQKLCQHHHRLPKLVGQKVSGLSSPSRPNFLNLFLNRFSQIGSSAPETLTSSAQVISTGEDVPGYKVEILVPPPSATPAGKKSARTTPAASGTATPANVEPTPQDLVLSVPEVTTLFLKTLLQSATDFLGVSPEDGCVIAAPSSFDAAQRQALTEAAQAAGINVVQIIDESAAVLVGYRAGLPAERLERGYVPEGQEEETADKVVVVVDVGETGVEVEMVAVRQGQYIHLGGGRDESVGGRELNKVVSAASLFFSLPRPFTHSFPPL